MSVKIRLQRHGKKAKAFYHIVVADARAPRDGKFIEKIGTYNPNTNPATIDLNRDSALTWLNNGAQPTDTCRAILSYKGVLYMNHLQGGVKKGALTQEQADAKFAAWLSEKDGKISSKKNNLSADKASENKNRLAAEAKVATAKAAAIAAKLVAAETAAVEAVAEETAVEATEEAPETDAPAATEEGTETAAE